MTYEHAITRYRHWYAKLLRFYPKPYRERFLEPMEQTFNDLLLERQEAGDGLFGFVLWVFADTLLGIIKEEIKYNMKSTQFKMILAISIIGSAVLIAMWWINGRDDTWLYATLVIITLSSFLYIKKDKDKK